MRPSRPAGPGIIATSHRGASITADLVAGDGDALHCFRHPDRETYVRCGRCDRPICTGCAMLGPVGMRCRDCGKPAYDPLTSFTPRQAVLALAVSIVGGTIAAFVASRIGFFSIILSFFAGGVIAEAVTRVTGYKRGPLMLGLVFAGIGIGSLLGFGAGIGLLLTDLNAMAAEVAAEVGEDAGDLPVGSFIVDQLTWAVLAAGAACAGAWSRLR